MDTSSWKIFSGYHAPKHATPFSSSLPVLPHQKFVLENAEQGCQAVDDVSPNLKEMHSDWEGNYAFEIDENHAIRSLLPDDEDELLAGMMDNFDLSGLLHHVGDVEEFDLFDSGGGLELESDSRENLSSDASNVSLSDIAGNEIAHFGLSNGARTVAGEHPRGEHPSRTLFVRNINSNVEDSELRSLFGQYGDIRTLYTACKHRGFVMVSYYDIRAARTAMRMLQTKPLRRRKLDIHFSIPKDNPSNKDVNQGTLVVFNLDPSVSNDDLRQIFGAYGHVKEIRETPYKRYHKFVEYYDTRAAEDAQRSLNRYAIAGKRIKIEPSRPGGARRNLMLHLSQDNKQDEHQSFRRQAGSSIGNSSQGNWPQLESSLEHGSLQSVSKSPGFRSPTMSQNLSGLDSILHPQSSTSIRVPLVGRDSDRRSQVDHIFTNGNTNCGAAFLQSLSFPEFNLSPDSRTTSFDASSFEALSGSQFFWGSPKLYSEPTNFSSLGGQCIGHHLTTNDQCHGFSFTNQGPFFGSSQGHQQHYHDAGSAPSDFPFESYFGFYQEPPGAFMNPSFGGVAYVQNDRNPVMNLSGCGSGSVSGNVPESGSSGFGSISSPGYSPLFLGNGHFSGIKGFTASGRGKRIESTGNQLDNSKQFQLDLDKIGSGEDTRTTLMIKNIPNKYTSKMLLAAIDENHRGTYDFLYLPIDFKNKCNIGYAFINMLSPLNIIPFCETFNGKRWEKFNSEKVASIAYARLQGKAALIAHFQNSSLMNEDKRCRPILLN